jgi:hypothetical protein
MTWMSARGCWAIAGLVVAAAGSLSAGGFAHAQPMIPSTFFGSASIDGKAVPDDTEVRGFVDGKDCTQPSERKGTLLDGGISAFSISVMHESQETGCGSDGKNVTFTVGGRPASQSAKWSSGVQHLDLNAGSGSPIPLPTSTSPTPNQAQAGATAPERAKFTPRPAGSLPTDDIDPNHVGTKAPGAPATGTTPDSGGSSALLVIAVIVAALAAGGGLAGFALSRRRREHGAGNGEQ